MNRPGISDSEPTAGDPGRCGLLGKLMAAVRPGFRGDELAFEPDDPVFGAKPCSVAGCDRGSQARGNADDDSEEAAGTGDPGGLDERTHRSER